MNKLWHALFTENKVELNLKSGFQTCGIFPLDKEQVLKKMNKTVTPGIEVDDGKVLSDAVLSYMKNLREPETLNRRVRKKKVSTAPGQSICIADFVHVEPAQKKCKQPAKKLISSSSEKPVLRKKFVSSVSPVIKKRLLSTVRKNPLRKKLVSSSTKKLNPLRKK